MRIKDVDLPLNIYHYCPHRPTTRPCRTDAIFLDFAKSFSGVFHPTYHQEDGLTPESAGCAGAVKVVRFRQTELIREFPETGFWSAIEAAPENNQGLGVTVEIAWVITIVVALIIVMLLFWFLLRGSDRVVTLIAEGIEVPLGIIIPKGATRLVRGRPNSTRLAPSTPINGNRQNSSSRRADYVPQADGAEQVDDVGLAVLMGDPGDLVNNASSHGSLPEPILRSSTTRFALILPNDPF